jgi:hypothetical protein
MLDTTNLTANDIEAIRQEAADRGDWRTTRTCNAALWGTSDRQRAAAKRKLAKTVGGAS